MSAELPRPACIDRLRALATSERPRHLDLSALDLRTVPIEILGSDIVSLDLRANSIQYLPTWITQLADLSSLDLAGNMLDELPSTIGELGSLVRLDVYGNNLTRLPDSIGLLRNLDSSESAETR